MNRGMEDNAEEPTDAAKKIPAHRDVDHGIEGGLSDAAKHGPARRGRDDGNKDDERKAGNPRRLIEPEPPVFIRWLEWLRIAAREHPVYALITLAIVLGAAWPFLKKLPIGPFRPDIPFTAVSHSLQKGIYKGTISGTIRRNGNILQVDVSRCEILWDVIVFPDRKVSQSEIVAVSIGLFKPGPTSPIIAEARHRVSRSIMPNTPLEFEPFEVIIHAPSDEAIRGGILEFRAHFADIPEASAPLAYTEAGLL